MRTKARGKKWKLVSRLQDGTVHIVAEMEGRVKNGRYVVYVAKKEIEVEGRYLNGEKHGRWRYRRPSNVHPGTWFFYREEIYHRGVMSGRTTEVHANGQLGFEVGYVGGRQEGKQTRYFENGRVEEEGEWKAGKWVGTWRGYFENGQLRYERHWDDGVPVGRWLEYYEDGHLRGEETNESGNLVGRYVRYYPDGQIREEGNWEAGMKVGRWVKQFPDGTPEQTFFYVDGQLHGEVLLYHPNGNIKGKQSWVDGSRRGHWQSFWENGTVREQEWYGESIEPYLLKRYSETGYLRSCWDRSSGGNVHYHENGKIEREHRTEVSADGKTRVNREASFFDNGQLRCEKVIVNNIRQGELKVFFRNGQRVYESWMEGDSRRRWIRYYPSGAVLSNSLFLEKKEGYATRFDHYIEHQEFYANGHIKRSATPTSDGAIVVTWFFGDGSPAKQMVLKNWRRDGESYSCYEAGGRAYSKCHRNGIPASEWREYYESGQCCRAIRFLGSTLDNGAVGFEWVDYDVRGMIQAKGRSDGPRVEISVFHTNGQIRLRGSKEGVSWPVDEGKLHRVSVSYWYEDQEERRSLKPESEVLNTWTDSEPSIETEAGLQEVFLPKEPDLNVASPGWAFDGEVTEYDTRGRKLLTSNYSHGLLQGRWTSYYPNGVVRLEGSYSGGKADGAWTSYFEGGRIRFHAEFESGRMVKHTSPSTARKERVPQELVSRAIARAFVVEGNGKPFILYGTGHEPRVMLGRTLRRIADDLNLPWRVVGKSRYYPKRVVDRAISWLAKQSGWSPIVIKGSTALLEEAKEQRE